MKIIGLTGGIASGKSTVSRYLAKLGALIVDTDGIALALAAPGEALWQAYTEHFGPQIIGAAGELDRAAIGRIVFADPQELAWIDSVAHPLIKERARNALAAGRDNGHEVAVLDVPLLFEAGWQDMADEVWVVYVTPEVQLARLMKRNGYGQAEAARRIAAQMSLEGKKALADIVIDNTASKKATLRQIKTAWQHLPERLRYTRGR